MAWFLPRVIKINAGSKIHKDGLTPPQDGTFLPIFHVDFTDIELHFRHNSTINLRTHNFHACIFDMIPSFIRSVTRK